MEHKGNGRADPEGEARGDGHTQRHPISEVVDTVPGDEQPCKWFDLTEAPGFAVYLCVWEEVEEEVEKEGWLRWRWRRGWRRRRWRKGRGGGGGGGGGRVEEEVEEEVEEVEEEVEEVEEEVEEWIWWRGRWRKGGGGGRGGGQWWSWSGRHQIKVKDGQYHVKGG